MADETFVVFYGESETEAKYLIRHTSLPRGTDVRPILPNDRLFPDNPAFVQQMLYLDKPDVIVAAGDPLRPVFGVEISAEAPTGHDAFQRFARIVAAAAQGTPFAYLFPQRKWVTRGTEAGRWDQFNPLILRALVQVSRFHNVPALPFLWPADRETGHPQQGYLLSESARSCLPPARHPEVVALRQFADLAIACYRQNRPFSELVFTEFFATREAQNWSLYHERGGHDGPWSPLTSCERVPTSGLLRRIRRITDVDLESLPDLMQSREASIIYTTDSRTFRADPYAGALVAVDYLTCRNGPTTQHRHSNLIISFPRASISQVVDKAQRYHRANCPLQMEEDEIRQGDRYYNLHLREGCRYTKQKEMRTICSFADMVVFADGILL
ncbi:hypothetical protein LLH23_17560 [bacterium]|nr:hypothetical protein [bacterium]